MIKDILTAKGLDAIVITSPENLRYLSGFTGGEGFLVLAKDQNTIIVDSRYTIQAKQQTEDFEVIEYKSNPYKLIADMGFSKIGFEDGTISYSVYNKLKDVASAFEGVSAEIDNLRKVKTDEEARCIRRAENIGDMAFEHILPFIKLGVTERDIALELEYFMKKNGADGLAFDSVVAVAERSALPHAEATDRAVEDGQFVLMDYGCRYNGYCGDMTRTVAVGNVDDKMKNIYDIVLKAQTESLKAVSAGVKNKEVDAVARNIIREAGFGDNFGHALGHGVGLLVHEAPNLSPRSEDVLQAGNIVTVEPGIYVEDFCGVRIEDLVLVTENGCENFTKSAKDLIIL